MLYRHTRRFQALLRAALRLSNFRLAELIKEAKLPVSKSSLDRFRIASEIHPFLKQEGEEALEFIDNLNGQFLNQPTAQKLWDFLTRSRHIEHAIHENNLRKSELYSNREIANAMHGFYSIDEFHQEEYVKKGVGGKYVCYKPSFRRPGFMLKSTADLRPVNNEFFEFEEHQRVVTDSLHDEESTDGFGLLKEGKLWVFGRENESQQPRILAFFKSFSDKGKIVGFYGHVMECAGTKGEFDFYPNKKPNRILMISHELDKELWLRHYGSDRPYNDDEQLDAFPYTDEASAQAPNARKIYIPEAIINYIEHGHTSF